MNSKQGRRLFAIVALAAALILGFVVATATNHAVSSVLLIEGGLIIVVGLIVALIGTLQIWRKKRSR